MSPIQSLNEDPAASVGSSEFSDSESVDSAANLGGAGDAGPRRSSRTRTPRASKKSKSKGGLLNWPKTKRVPLSRIIKFNQPVIKFIFKFDRTKTYFKNMCG